MSCAHSSATILSKGQADGFTYSAEHQAFRREVLVFLRPPSCRPKGGEGARPSAEAVAWQKSSDRPWLRRAHHPEGIWRVWGSAGHPEVPHHR